MNFPTKMKGLFNTKLKLPFLLEQKTGTGFSPLVPNELKFPGQTKKAE